MNICYSLRLLILLIVGGKDTCQGDSGGGLYSYDSNIQRYVVVGITSYGYGCAEAGYPGIYTRISYFYNWIMAKAKYDKINSATTTTTNTSPSNLFRNSFNSILLLHLFLICFINYMLP